MSAVTPAASSGRAISPRAAALGLGLLALGGVILASERLASAPAPASGHAVTEQVAAVGDESVVATFQRAGLRPPDARGAADLLADTLGPGHALAGVSFALHAEPATEGPGLRLIDLVALRQGRSVAKVARGADGALRLDAPPPAGPGDAVPGAPRVLTGPMEDVLYGDPAKTSVGGDPVRQAMRLFARKLDLTRDIALGDPVTIVFVPGQWDGLAANARLLFAEIDTSGGPTRFYAHRRSADGADEFVDANGVSQTAALLRTPLDVARVTSGFGMRLHPLLGYSRMHEGVDFGAPVGTPVVAASDGVVEQARWAGGYGRWIRLRHSASLETAYAHLSAWAAGLEPGQRVRQGEVIGYVGTTGLSTGPHLHFEVIDRGRPVDPKGVATSVATRLSGADQAAFSAEKQIVADALAASGKSS